MKHLYVAGKSGGHIIPGLTLAAADVHAGISVAFIALDRPLDRSLIDPASYLQEALFLRLDTIYPRRWWCYPLYTYQLVRALWVSQRLLRRWKPTQIISMGGAVSLPLGIAAWIQGIPLVVYELNAEPGTAVRVLARWAKEVRCCFASIKDHLPHATIRIVPYPLRYSDKDLMVSEKTPHQKTLLILGGSQGSRQLNELLRNLLIHLPVTVRTSLHIIHQTGTDQENSLRDWYRQQHIAADVFAYRDDLAPAYRAATGIMTRAGSGALHEIAHFQKPALIIPLETTTTSHQCTNAKVFAARNPTLWVTARINDTEHIMLWLQHVLQES